MTLAAIKKGVASLKGDGAFVEKLVTKTMNQSTQSCCVGMGEAAGACLLYTQGYASVCVDPPPPSHGGLRNRTPLILFPPLPQTTQGVEDGIFTRSDGQRFKVTPEQRKVGRRVVSGLDARA